MTGQRKVVSLPAYAVLAIGGDGQAWPMRLVQRGPMQGSYGVLEWTPDDANRTLVVLQNLLPDTRFALDVLPTWAAVEAWRAAVNRDGGADGVWSQLSRGPDGALLGHCTTWAQWPEGVSDGQERPG